MNIMPTLRRVLQRGSNSHTFASHGAYSESVTIAGVADVAKVRESLTGATCSAVQYFGAAIYLTNVTTLTIYYWASAACTVTAEWETVVSDGLVQRGNVAINGSSGGEATGNATITAVNTTNAKVHQTGIHLPSTGSNTGGYKADYRLYLTSSTNLRAVLSCINTSNTFNCYYVVESF